MSYGLPRRLRLAPGALGLGVYDQPITPGGPPPSHDRRQSAALARALRQSQRLIEQYRRIYYAVQPTDAQTIIPSIGVTSARAGEGRTTVAVGVAATMGADLERPVVLAEVDLAHPGVHRVLDLDPEPGLCEYLRHECDLASALRQVSDRLYILPAGNAAGDDARLIRQLVNADLRGRLGRNGAVLVLDLPPILATSYGVAACTMAETLVFVVRAGRTTDDDVKDALTRLNPLAADAVVLNGAHRPLPRWLINLVQ